MKHYKIIISISVLIIFLIFLYIDFFRNPKVLATYAKGNVIRILVKEPPLTDLGKLKWWEGYKSNVISNTQDYYISIWNFDGEYLEQIPKNEGFFPDHDIDYLLCFDEIKSAKRCIDKSSMVMSVMKANDGYIYYQIDGASYYRKPSGKLIKNERVETKID